MWQKWGLDLSVSVGGVLGEDQPLTDPSPPIQSSTLRYSLTQETRALTKVLKCVDWGDALEAKQVCQTAARKSGIPLGVIRSTTNPHPRRPI